MEWVSVFYLGGTEYREGQSWLQATYNGEQILGFLPEHSIFRYNGRLFALLHLYPTAQNDEFGLPTITIPDTFEPEAKVVALDSPKLEDVTPFSPSYRVQRAGTIMYRFAPLL